VKLKLLKSNAAIWNNKIYKAKQLTPKYIDIRVNENNKQSKKNTKLAAIKYSLNQEIKFLCSKKQKLKEKFYNPFGILIKQTL
jgi:hypothetical protein